MAAAMRTTSGLEMTKTGMAIIATAVSLIGAGAAAVASYATTKVTTEAALDARPTRGEMRSADSALVVQLNGLRSAQGQIEVQLRTIDGRLQQLSDQQRTMLCDALRARPLLCQSIGALR